MMHALNACHGLFLLKISYLKEALLQRNTLSFWPRYEIMTKSMELKIVGQGRQVMVHVRA